MWLLSACAPTPELRRSEPVPVASGLTSPVPRDCGVVPVDPVPGDVLRCTCPHAWSVGDARVARDARYDGPLAPGDLVRCGRARAVVGEALPPTNVLLVVVDDVGADNLALYGTGHDYPATPRIDALAASGTTFLRAFTHPVCSPSRASLQTGRSPDRHGVTDVLYRDGDGGLALEEETLAELVGRAPDAWDTAFVGKWHLGTDRDGRLADQPNAQGYAWFDGSLFGLGQEGADGADVSYYDWERVTNGVVSRSETYATTAIADAAIERLAVLAEPWLLVVAFPAAHGPVEWPPDALRPDELAGETVEVRKYHATVSALDHELGRVLDALGPERAERTTVVFTADNGPWSDVASPPGRQAKGTPREAGSHVPLVVTGPHAVPGARTRALAQLSDVYATVADLAGVPAGPERDSASLLPALHDPGGRGRRDYARTLQIHDDGVGFRAVRDARWKLVEPVVDGVRGVQRLYDLQGRAHEGRDLLTAPAPELEEIRQRLERELVGP